MNCAILLLPFFVAVHVSLALKDDAAAVDFEKLHTLHLPELLNVSLASDVGHRYANIIYKWKYGDNRVDIWNMQDDKRLHHHDNIISIANDMVIKFIEAFGESIKKLTIAYVLFSKDLSQEYGRLVNLHCSKTLIEFEARFFEEGAFDDMQTPFEKVKRVILHGRWTKLNESSLSPDKLFPKMRRLDITYSDGVIFDYHYPHLKELYADIKPSVGFMKFFERNPQIKALNLQGVTSVELLKTIDENLLELEVLRFQMPNDFLSHSNVVFQFNSVKNVYISDYLGHIRLGNITFEQLERLQLTNTGDVDKAWINFIVEHRRLKSIKVGYVNESTLLALSSNHLEEVNLRFDRNIEAENIVQFLEGNPQMGKLTLDLAKWSTQTFYSLTEKLENKWRVATVNNRYNLLSLSKLFSNPHKSNESSQISENSMENSSESDENFENDENSTENSTNNTTQSENTSTSGASIISSTISTITLIAIIINIFAI